MMATVGNDLSTWLAKELYNRTWSARELGRRIGLSGTSISRYLEGSLTPSPKTCRKIAAALGADPQEIMRLAGHLPPALPAVEGEEEALAILRDLPAAARATVMQMLRGLRAVRVQAHARSAPSPVGGPALSPIGGPAPGSVGKPARVLVETPPQYAAQALDEEIAALVEVFPRLAPLFEEAQAGLPEHAIRALVMNVKIWIHERQAWEDFTDLRNRLGRLLSSM